MPGLLLALAGLSRAGIVVARDGSGGGRCRSRGRCIGGVAAGLGRGEEGGGDGSLGEAGDPDFFMLQEGACLTEAHGWTRRRDGWGAVGKFVAEAAQEGDHHL